MNKIDPSELADSLLDFFAAAWALRLQPINRRQVETLIDLRLVQLDGRTVHLLLPDIGEAAAVAEHHLLIPIELHQIRLFEFVGS